MENIQPKLNVVHVIANQQSVPYLNQFAEGLHNYPGVKFTVVALFPVVPRMAEEMRLRGCEFHWIKFDKRFKTTWMAYALFKLIFLFRKIKPDVVCTHLFDDSVPGLLAARITGVKKRVIRKQVTADNWYFHRFWVWGDILNNINATDIIAISEESKKFLIEKEKAPAKKIHLVYNGLPLARCSRQSEKEKQDFAEKYQLKNKFVIGTVARFVEWKGHRYIIEAAKMLVEKYPNLKFLFAGQGGLRKELEELVKQNGLEEFIVFTGFIEPNHMPSLYGVMDVCLHAAFMEPFGFVYIEAMLNGVPIITSKTGIAAEILEHKSTCYFTNSNDPQGIANGVQWMIENPEIREAMKEKLKKLADNRFSIETMLDEHIKVFKGIV